MSIDPNNISIEELLAKADRSLSMPLGKKKRKPGRPRNKKRVAKNGNGYRYVYVNGKPELEHRLVMEKHLGRKLLPHEAVFFRNGKKYDIAISNLILGLKQGIPLDSITCPHCSKTLG